MQDKSSINFRDAYLKFFPPSSSNLEKEYERTTFISTPHSELQIYNALSKVVPAPIACLPSGPEKYKLVFSSVSNKKQFIKLKSFKIGNDNVPTTILQDSYKYELHLYSIPSTYDSFEQALVQGREIDLPGGKYRVEAQAIIVGGILTGRILVTTNFRLNFNVSIGGKQVRALPTNQNTPKDNSKNRLAARSLLDQLIPLNKALSNVISNSPPSASQFPPLGRGRTSNTSRTNPKPGDSSNSSPLVSPPQDKPSQPSSALPSPIPQSNKWGDDESVGDNQADFSEEVESSSTPSSPTTSQVCDDKALSISEVSSENTEDLSNEVARTLFSSNNSSVNSSALEEGEILEDPNPFHSLWLHFEQENPCEDFNLAPSDAAPPQSPSTIDTRVVPTPVTVSVAPPQVEPPVTTESPLTPGPDTTNIQLPTVQLDSASLLNNIPKVCTFEELGRRAEQLSAEITARRANTPKVPTPPKFPERVYHRSTYRGGEAQHLARSGKAVPWPEPKTAKYKQKVLKLKHILESAVDDRHEHLSTIVAVRGTSKKKPNYRSKSTSSPTKPSPEANPASEEL